MGVLFLSLLFLRIYPTYYFDLGSFYYAVVWVFRGFFADFFFDGGSYGLAYRGEAVVGVAIGGDVTRDSDAGGFGVFLALFAARRFFFYDYVNEEWFVFSYACEVAGGEHKGGDVGVFNFWGFLFGVHVNVQFFNGYGAYSCLGNFDAGRGCYHYAAAVNCAADSSGEGISNVCGLARWDRYYWFAGVSAYFRSFDGGNVDAWFFRASDGDGAEGGEGSDGAYFVRAFCVFA